MSKFYITTAIDYTNDVIHIGHAYQKIIADVLARYHRLIGDKVFFLTGTDEHGEKSETAAEKAGRDVKDFVDEIAKKNQEQLDSLNISYDRFIRTTDKDHVETVKKFWQQVLENNPDDIYLGDFEGLYCQGCEAYLSDWELTNDKCLYHPNQPIQKLKEKNYFFRWSKYQNFLQQYLLNHPEFAQPESSRKEMLAFLDQGLKDIPISRQNVKWGISVPSDFSQTIYVWFDALINYISGDPDGFWPADLHVLGKDNTRWHVLLWPAMLKSAGYELPKAIYTHGFLTLNGQKISKSLGNIIRPTELIDEFGSDAIRYFLMRFKPLDSDGDITIQKIKETYNADLANGLGNLVSRVAKLCEINNYQFKDDFKPHFIDGIPELITNFQISQALEKIWIDAKEGISTIDKFINDKKIWKLEVDKAKIALAKAVRLLLNINYNIKPFMPKTAEKIEKVFKQGTRLDSPLFPRVK